MLSSMKSEITWNLSGIKMEAFFEKNLETIETCNNLTEVKCSMQFHAVIK